MSKEEKKGENNNNNKTYKNSFDYIFWNTQLFQLPSLWSSYSTVFLSIHMQSSECILVILCLLFLFDLGLYTYPSRLISHCQGWCPIGKFSRFLQKPFQILPLTVKNSGIFYWFFHSLLCIFFLLFFFPPSLYVFPH